MNNQHIFSGTIPALMTPCDASGKPDFTELVKTAKSLIEAGMDSVVYCGSMGDWPLLTDEERMEGFTRILDVIKSIFKTVILISHLDNLKDSADMVLPIAKKDGYASINY